MWHWMMLTAMTAITRLLQQMSLSRTSTKYKKGMAPQSGEGSWKTGLIAVLILLLPPQVNGWLTAGACSTVSLIHHIPYGLDTFQQSASSSLNSRSLLASMPKKFLMFAVNWMIQGVHLISKVLQSLPWVLEVAGNSSYCFSEVVQL